MPAACLAADPPQDNQIRNLLDPLQAEHLFAVFAEVATLLEESGELQLTVSIGTNPLITLDGTQYFSSHNVHCDACTHTTSATRHVTTYSHTVLLPMSGRPAATARDRLSTRIHHAARWA